MLLLGIKLAICVLGVVVKWSKVLVAVLWPLTVLESCLHRFEPWAFHFLLSCVHITSFPTLGCMRAFTKHCDCNHYLNQILHCLNTMNYMFVSVASLEDCSQVVFEINTLLSEIQNKIKWCYILKWQVFQ